MTPEPAATATPPAPPATPAPRVPRNLLTELHRDGWPANMTLQDIVLQITEGE